MSAGAGGFIAEQRKLAAADKLGEFMLNALRLNRGFTMEQFEARTGLEVQSLEPQLGRLCAQGLLERDTRGVRATAQGHRFLDTVVAEFFPEEA